MRRRKPRSLSASEAALWRAVAASVTPLHPHPDPEPPQPFSDSKKSQRPPQRAKSLPTLPRTPPAKEIDPGKFGSGDPRLGRRVARGRLPIAATLDLHGLTQDQAYGRLCHFLEFAAARGDRSVLIITGKGQADEAAHYFEEAPRGILRRRFLEWIDGPPLRSLISSVQQAHQKHGGRGAFYVFLKRP